MLGMKLSTLLAPYLQISQEQDCEITGLALDSREVKPGDVFFAYRGTHSDGRDYIDAAIDRGAKVILYEPGAAVTTDRRDNVVLFALEQVQQLVSKLASRFYGDPSQQMAVIGITGTNGKTSVAHFTAQALTALGKKVGVIGTLGAYIFSTDVHAFGRSDNRTLTTPNPIALQQQLAQFKAENVDVVVMEVSSHALDQHRADGIAFDIAVFTNLSRDHLDYHHNMEAYFEAKKRLFFFPSLQAVVVNESDEYGGKLAEEFGDKVELYEFLSEGSKVETSARPNVNYLLGEFLASESSLRLLMKTKSDETKIMVKPFNLIGNFNVMNVLAAAAVVFAFFDLQANGRPELAKIINSLSQLTPPEGRMQTFGGGDKPLVVVDFAHTPDALEKVLSSVQQLRRPDVPTSRRSDVFLVFGCGGDRDAGKRPLMGKIAEQYADHIYLTNDNPRTEEPEQIIDQILAGISQQASVTIELDRAKAIKQAISQAKAGDVVLIAGKGHEHYQIIGEQKLNFSDQAVVEQSL